jgi:hypothetical protein
MCCEGARVPWAHGEHLHPVVPAALFGERIVSAAVVERCAAAAALQAMWSLILKNFVCRGNACASPQHVCFGSWGRCCFKAAS